MALVASATMGTSGCGRSQEAEVRAAILARFPEGARRCLQLAGDVVGIHVTAPPNGTLYYPSDGITSPMRHGYVFYAAPATAAVPDLVGELSGLGIIHETDVEATDDEESSGPGPQLVSASGFHSHEEWYRHTTRTFPVRIFTTAAQDGRFQYETRRMDYGRASGGPDLPSRMYTGPLPPADRHYTLPTVTPYALSIATAACFPETIGTVDDIRKEVAWNGEQALLADVAFDQHPPEWMSSPAFRRAALRYDTPSLTAPRKAVIRFRMADGKLSYLSEVTP